MATRKITHRNPLTGVLETVSTFCPLGRAIVAGDAALVLEMCREVARQERVFEIRADRASAWWTIVEFAASQGRACFSSYVGRIGR